jgi:Zn ribbon nucleic-acid-binding protein
MFPDPFKLPYSFVAKLVIWRENGMEVRNCFDMINCLCGCNKRKDVSQKISSPEGNSITVYFFPFFILLLKPQDVSCALFRW